MKAPDKIYLQRGVKAPFETWTYRECPAYKNIEYIRKDALLDWLKECKENPVITDLQRGNIQEIIDKIESL